MPTQSLRRHISERARSLKDKDEKPSKAFLTKNLQKVYPIGFHKSGSSLNHSPFPLLQNSIDHRPKTSWEVRVPASRVGSVGRRSDGGSVGEGEKGRLASKDDGVLKRCSWITKSSDELYVAFHDECWGVPVNDDKEVFSRFDANIVANMEEREIIEVVKEYGSFSAYLWSYMNYKPIINEYKNSNNIPLRTTRSESISKDLLRRGFRLVGPTIVHSFMQASGMTNDHLSHCFRFKECVKLACG
ncbi:hypothetical protein QJS04_geneDACA006690 [Acorus gramineus]|uniref:DNA-3-methyladenine glycosylase I n=1 Tax=Acorus gramineus TaxID=55184 RepID=A0AAV9B020_ACOGR|nr:hypothetical protein QJS04_geneDACA006690 [Acorus gramineus]